MIIFCDEGLRIMDVDSTDKDNLTPYELAEPNPFENWSDAKICCYRVGLTPEVITEVIGTKEETYTDLDSNEQTRTVDVTEDTQTGKYVVTMMTPYVDTRIIPKIEDMYVDINNNTEEISITTDTLEAVMEEVLPAQAMTTDELFEAVDTLMTEIIPSLMMDNE